MVQENIYGLMEIYEGIWENNKGTHGMFKWSIW